MKIWMIGTALLLSNALTAMAVESDRVVFNVVRDGKHLEFPMILPINPAD